MRDSPSLLLLVSAFVFIGLFACNPPQESSLDLHEIVAKFEPSSPTDSEGELPCSYLADISVSDNGRGLIRHYRYPNEQDQETWDAIERLGSYGANDLASDCKGELLDLMRDQGLFVENRYYKEEEKKPFYTVKIDKDACEEYLSLE